MYHVQFFAYCGMAGERHTFEERQQARAFLGLQLNRARARARRLGGSVVVLQRGERFEVQEPEDSRLVPDWCGEWVLRRETFECRECGGEHDTAEAAAGCCAVDFLTDGELCSACGCLLGDEPHSASCPETDEGEWWDE